MRTQPGHQGQEHAFGVLHGGDYGDLKVLQQECVGVRQAGERIRVYLGNLEHLARGGNDIVEAMNRGPWVGG